MTSRERLIAAMNHQPVDRIPFDLGSTSITGIHVSSLYTLKVSLGLISPQEPVKVINPFLMLGEVDEALRKRLEIDTISLPTVGNSFGFENENWKPWKLFDGTPVFVPEKFNTVPDRNGNILQYPKGDKKFQPSACMPNGGFYHDPLIRKKEVIESELTVENQTEEYKILQEETLRFYESEAERLFRDTQYGIIFRGVSGSNLSDIAHIPGCGLPDPKGIRDFEEWYISLITRKDFIKDVFTRMTEIALENLKLVFQAVGNKIQVIVISAADFGSQNGLFVSPDLYRELFKPFHQRVNNWIHQHTNWKTFIHTCGSISPLLPDLHEAGFDILNPVQISAVNMDPVQLKEKYGKWFTFWGGGVNTQKTLPFGSPEEVREEVEYLIEVFGKNSGFVWNAVHNIQAKVPVENLKALFEAIQEHRARN
ncbi:MAG TPA: methyltransferase [Candidatus Atribacteria bacterium]|nr:methyltransferase [Candidatus Atribacteria bacterium]